MKQELVFGWWLCEETYIQYLQPKGDNQINLFSKIPTSDELMQNLKPYSAIGSLKRLLDELRKQKEKESCKEK